MQAYVETVDRVAQDYGLSVRYRDGRRECDLCLLEVEGDSAWLLAFYAKLMEHLPELELELFSSAIGEGFGRKAALLKSAPTLMPVRQERRRSLQLQRISV